MTRIFIAEDSEFLREILMRDVSVLAGVEVVGCACSGEATIAGIRDSKPDIVLLDLSMPSGGGFAVLEALRPTDSRPFFVVLTMHTQRVFRDQCETLGVHVFLDKASELPRLLAALETLAGREFDLPELLEAFSPEHQPAETYEP